MRAHGKCNLRRTVYAQVRASERVQAALARAVQAAEAQARRNEELEATLASRGRCVCEQVPQVDSE